MKYQLRNSTVTFINKSVQTEAVTAWKWYFDSGSGFVQQSAPNPAVSCDIHFPDSAGTLCTVRLVAEGTWGANVVYEQQYITVEDVAAPVLIAPSSLTGATLYNGVYEEKHFFTVQAGTGAGDLTYSINAGVSGMSINADTGEVSGVPWGLGMSGTTGGTLTFRVIVQDALGRSAYIDIAQAMSPFVCACFDAIYGITETGGFVSRWDNKAPIGTMYWAQAIGTDQPQFVADDGGFPAVKIATVSGTARSLDAVGFTSDANYSFLAVLRVLSNPSDSNYRPIYYTNGGAGILTCEQSMMYCVNSGSNKTGFVETYPWVGYSIVSGVVSSSAGRGVFMKDGIQRGSKASTYMQNGSPYRLGTTTEAYSPDFNLRELWVFGYGSFVQAETVGVPEAMNRIHQYLANKYSIPCKKFSSFV